MSRRLSVDELRDVLPEVEELRPLFDHLLARSEPDQTKTWSGSGRLGTVGSRLVSAAAVSPEAAEALAAAEGARLRELYAHATRALAAVVSGDHAAAADALLQAAALEEAGDRHDRAAAYAAAAHRAARHARSPRPAALALRRWARACKSSGQLSEAIDLYRRSYEAERAVSDARGAAEAAIGAGNVLEAQGRWDAAASWYRSALAETEALGERATERWQALLNLHIVTRSSGALDESVALLRDAEAAAAAVGAEDAEPAIENAWGQLRMAERAFDDAQRHLRSALQAAAGARARVTIRLNLAETLLAQRRTLEAAEQAREAEREALVASLVPKLPEVYRLLGRIASAEGDPDAFVLFERALEIVRERALPSLEEAMTLQAYAEAELRRGEPETARQLQERAAELFAALGIERMRAPWADVFGDPGSRGGSQSKEESEDEA